MSHATNGASFKPALHQATPTPSIEMHMPLWSTCPGPHSPPRTGIADSTGPARTQLRRWAGPAAARQCPTHESGPEAARECHQLPAQRQEERGTITRAQIIR